MRRSLMMSVMGGKKDTTAPLLSSASVTSYTNTTSALSVTTNEATGTLYWVVDTGLTPPSAAQVKAGQGSGGAAAAASGSQAITSTGAKTANASGLIHDTAYYAYFMHEDFAGNQSTVAAATVFTTWVTAPTGAFYSDAALANYAAQRTTISKNTQAAPDGANHGALVTEDSTASNNHNVNHNIGTTEAATYVSTIFAKRVTGTRNLQTIFYDGSYGSSFVNGIDLSNCTINNGPQVTGATFKEPSGNAFVEPGGWYRLIGTFLTGVTAIDTYMEMGSGTNDTYSGDGTSSIGLWGVDFRKAIETIRNPSVSGGSAPSTPPTYWTINYWFDTQASITATIIGFGTDTGIPYMDLRVAGTYTGSADRGMVQVMFEGNVQIVAAQNDIWRQGLYLKRTAGSWTGFTNRGVFVENVNNNSNGDWVQSYYTGPYQPDGTLRWYSSTQKILEPSTAFVQPHITIEMNKNIACDVTLRIGRPSNVKVSW